MLELLDHRGFSARWREWLTIIFKSSHSTVLLNGTEGSNVNHVRGLQQGDPLYPYLFILSIDTLHRILEVATENGTLSPLRGRNAKLRLSLYADDAVIFINPVREEVRALFSILELFGAATGLRLNIEKCTVAPIRCAAVNLDHVLQDFRGKKIKLSNNISGLAIVFAKTQGSPCPKHY